MKSRLIVWLLALMASLSIGMLNAGAQLSFSAGIEIRAGADFYEPLSPYGSWVTIGSHGRCWHPTGVETGWRPYCIGHWEWTDCGWYWVSDEPWAWACYHYGGWVDDPRAGWVWVPGTEWAPAWVTWREGGDYIGWAPCGPGGIVLAPSLFIFVDLHHFRDRHRPSSVIVNDTTIINRTKRVGDFKRENRNIDGASHRVVINEGPGVDPVQKATGHRFDRVPVRDMIRQTPVPTNLRRGGPEPGRTDRSREIQEKPRDRTSRPEPLPPESPRKPLEPTGRERVLPETQPRAVPPERDRAPSREQVVPERPTPTPAPSERALPPTGRERGYERNEGNPPPREHSAPPAQPPTVREARPARPPAPPPEPERGRNREKDNP
jgi:uncharacterized protein DUF6600